MEKYKVGMQLVTTYSLMKRIKKISNKGEESAKKEMKQQHNRTCFVPK